MHIPTSQRSQLQRSLIRSHAASSGDEVEAEVVRGTALLRLRTLATGRTGVRPRTAQAYADLLNAGITLVVREYGWLGCSGDLAPLAHVALAVMGEGEVRTESGLLPAATALAEAGLEPVELVEKEGLALINGTDGMLAMLMLACADLARLLQTADLTAAMSLGVLLGTDRTLAADVVGLRPHPGQAAAAANMRRLLQGIAVVASHRGPEDTGCRRRTACGARRRSLAQCATPWSTAAPSPLGRRPALSTTRRCSTTAGSSPTATSTGRRSRTPWTSTPWPSPTWPR